MSSSPPASNSFISDNIAHNIFSLLESEGVGVAAVLARRNCL